jgi:hypothetical protein
MVARSESVGFVFRRKLKMNNRIAAVVLVFLALGGAAMVYQSFDPPVTKAQTTTPSNPSTSSAQPSGSGNTSAIPGFNYGRAKLENERNTIEIVDRLDQSIGSIKARATQQSDMACDPSIPQGYCDS